MYTHRQIVRMLFKLMKLCEIMGSQAYAGLQCDGIHFGKAGGTKYGCHGMSVVTDVVLQMFLLAVCTDKTPRLCPLGA